MNPRTRSAFAKSLFDKIHSCTYSFVKVQTGEYLLVTAEIKEVLNHLQQFFWVNDITTTLLPGYDVNKHFAMHIDYFPQLVDTHKADAQACQRFICVLVLLEQLLDKLSYVFDITYHRGNCIISGEDPGLVILLQDIIPPGMLSVLDCTATISLKALCAAPNHTKKSILDALTNTQVRHAEYAAAAHEFVNSMPQIFFARRPGVKNAMVRIPFTFEGEFFAKRIIDLFNAKQVGDEFYFDCQLLADVHYKTQVSRLMLEIRPSTYRLADFANLVLLCSNGKHSFEKNALRITHASPGEADTLAELCKQMQLPFQRDNSYLVFSYTDIVALTLPNYLYLIEAAGIALATISNKTAAMASYLLELHLQHLILSGDLATFQQAFTRSGFTVNTVFTTGIFRSNTVVLIAAATGAISILQWLVKQGGNIHSCSHDGQLVMTPLCAAVTYGHHTMVETLIDMGADVNQVIALPDGNPDLDSKLNGCTALFSAVAAGQADMVVLLMEKGAKFAPRHASGLPARPLMDSVIHFELLEVLRALLLYSINFLSTSSIRDVRAHMKNLPATPQRTAMLQLLDEEVKTNDAIIYFFLRQPHHENYRQYLWSFKDDCLYLSIPLEARSKAALISYFTTQNMTFFLTNPDTHLCLLKSDALRHMETLLKDPNHWQQYLLNKRRSEVQDKLRSMTKATFFKKLNEACGATITVQNKRAACLLVLNHRTCALLQPTLTMITGLSFRLDDTFFDQTKLLNDDAFYAPIRERRQQLDAFFAFTAEIGKRKITEDQDGITVRFQQPEDANKFAQLIAGSPLATGLTFSYAMIFADHKPLFEACRLAMRNEVERTNHEQNYRLRLLLALSDIIPESSWQEQMGILNATNVKPATLAILASIGLTLPIKLASIYEWRIEQFSQLIQDIRIAQNKIRLVVEMINHVKTGKINYCDTGFVVELQHLDHLDCFAGLIAAREDNHCTLHYSDMLASPWQALLEQRSALAHRLQPATEKPVVVKAQRDDKPAPPAPRAPIVLAAKPKTTKKPTTHKKKNPAAVPKTNTAPAPTKPKRTGTQIAPQPQRGLEILSTPAGGGYVDPKRVLAATEGAAPWVVAPVRPAAKLPAAQTVNVHEDVIQSELQFLSSLYDWYELPANQASLTAHDILLLASKLSLIRLMNAIDLRFRATPNCIQLSRDEDHLARDLRARLIHYCPDLFTIKAFYLELTRDEIGAVYDHVLRGFAPSRPLLFGKYLDTFFQKPNVPIDYTQEIMVIFRHLTSVMAFYQESENMFALRALEACIAEFGQLAKFLPLTHGLSPEVRDFILSCRPIRNDVMHNNVEDEGNEFDPVGKDTILTKAKYGMKFN